MFCYTFLLTVKRNCKYWMFAIKGTVYFGRYGVLTKKRCIVHKSMNGPFVVILYNIIVKCLNQRSGRNLCFRIARKTQTW